MRPGSTREHQPLVRKIERDGVALEWAFLGTRARSCAPASRPGRPGPARPPVSRVFEVNVNELAGAPSELRHITAADRKLVVANVIVALVTEPS